MLKFLYIRKPRKIRIRGYKLRIDLNLPTIRMSKMEKYFCIHGLYLTKFNIYWCYVYKLFTISSLATPGYTG